MASHAKRRGGGGGKKHKSSAASVASGAAYVWVCDPQLGQHSVQLHAHAWRLGPCTHVFVCMLCAGQHSLVLVPLLPMQT